MVATISDGRAFSINDNYFVMALNFHFKASQILLFHYFFPNPINYCISVNYIKIHYFRILKCESRLFLRHLITPHAEDNSTYTRLQNKPKSPVKELYHGNKHKKWQTCLCGSQIKHQGYYLWNFMREHRHDGVNDTMPQQDDKKAVSRYCEQYSHHITNTLPLMQAL